MAKIFIAQFSSRHFDFDGVGKSEREAVDVCLQGMRAHGKQCRLVDDWHDVNDRAPWDELRYNFIIREIVIGTAYRDRSEIR